MNERWKKICFGVVLLMVSFCCLVSMGRETGVAPETCDDERKLDVELGAWVSDNDARLLLFFEGNTYYDITHIRTIRGNWKRLGEQKVILTDVKGNKTTFSISGDLLTQNHIDYTGFYKRILKVGRDHVKVSQQHEETNP